jgi:hypothetical protein
MLGAQKSGNQLSLISAQKKNVPGTGLEPARRLRSKGFSYHYNFRYNRKIAGFVVWTVSLPCDSKSFRHLPFSLYTFKVSYKL